MQNKPIANSITTQAAAEKMYHSGFGSAQIKAAIKVLLKPAEGYLFKSQVDEYIQSFKDRGLQ